VLCLAEGHAPGPSGQEQSVGDRNVRRGEVRAREIGRARKLARHQPQPALEHFQRLHAAIIAGAGVVFLIARTVAGQLLAPIVDPEAENGLGATP